MSPLLWLFEPWFWIQALVPLTGWLLVRRGLRARGRGDGPQCHQCDYSLTGLTSSRCPECGTAIDERRSRRRQRGWRIQLCIGSVLLLATVVRAGQVGLHSAGRLNWYSLQPFDWILREAEAGSIEAANELQRRFRWRTLAAGEIDALRSRTLQVVNRSSSPANLPAWLLLFKRLGGRAALSTEEAAALYAGALARVSRPGDTAHLSEWLDLMRGGVAARDLTQEQIAQLAGAATGRAFGTGRDSADRSAWLETLDELAAAGHLPGRDIERLFSECMPEPRAAVRPRVAHGACIPVDVLFREQFNWPRYTHASLAAYEVQVAGREVFAASGDQVAERVRVRECLEGLELPPGAHELRCRAVYDFRLTGSSDGLAEVHRSRLEAVATAALEVLPPGRSDDLAILDDPAMKEAFARNFVLRRARRGHTETTVRLVLFWDSTVPASAFFDVTVRGPTGAHEAGTIHCDRAARGRAMIDVPRNLLSESGATSIQLAMRSRPELARQTVDVIEVWDGDLTLGPFEVETP